MSLPSLEGRSFGPHPYHLCPARVADFVTATRDDPGRWEGEAPPTVAAGALFVVAPHLLREVEGWSVIHGDQSFAWAAPIPVSGELAVTGRVTRWRERGGVVFAGFELVAEGPEGGMLTGSSTFLISPPSSTGAEVEEEPPYSQSGPNSRLDVLELPSPGEPVPPLSRSASREDLVRYAAASGDWNPIHWDHQAAVAAGLPGVVVHGLLQSAWLCQAAARLVRGPAPLATARFRYRAPLRPAVPATVTGKVGEDGLLDLALSAGDTDFVTASMRLRS